MLKAQAFFNGFKYSCPMVRRPEMEEIRAKERKLGQDEIVFCHEEI